MIFRNGIFSPHVPQSACVPNNEGQYGEVLEALDLNSEMFNFRKSNATAYIIDFTWSKLRQQDFSNSEAKIVPMDRIKQLLNYFSLGIDSVVL